MSSGLGMATKRSHDGETKQQLQQQHHFQQQQEGGNNNNIQQRSQHPQQHERRRPSGERDKPTTAPNTSTISQEKDGSGMVSAENNTMSGGDVRTPNSAAGATEQVSRKKGRPKSPVPKNGKSEKGIGDVSGSGSGKNQQQEQQETVTPDSNGNNAVVSNISSNDNNGNSNDNSGSPENGESPAQHLAATTAATTAASSGAATASTALVAPPSPAAPLTITAEEVNFLIYRYLQESGFVHSSFTFAHESLVGRTRPRNAGGIPPGALILFLQKGLQYVGMEECVLREMEGGAVAATAAVVGGTAAGGGTDGATNAAVTGDEDKDGDNGKLIALRPNKKAKASSSSSSPLHSHSSNDKDKEQGGETTPTNQAAAPASDITTFLGPDFTLLCPRSLHTLTRKDPPIKLRVPPASAAAAIKARMEMEEKLARERRAMELEEEKERRKRKKMLREESGLIIASGAGAAKDAMSYAVVGEDLAGEAMAVDEKKSERKKKSQAARAGEAAGPADHGTGKGAKSKKAKAAAAAAVNHANAAMEEAQEIEEHVPTPKKKKKKKKNAILAAEEEEPPSQADQQQPLAQQQPQNVSLEKSTASKEKPKTLPSPGMSSQKATPMDMDELETSSLASTKQRQKQSDFQLQQQQQQQQAAMNMANKGQGSGAANSSMSQIEATAAAMRAAASKGGIFPHGITTSLNQLNASKGQGPNSLSNTPSIDQKHRSSSVDNNPHSSRGGTPTVNAPGPGGPNIAGFNMHAMHQRQQELREMEIAAAKRMQEAQRFQDPQRFQEAQRMQQEAQAGLHRLQQERQMWEMQQQQQQGGNVNRGSGMGGSSERGGLPQAYQSMDVDAAEVARQRAELQAVLAQRHQAVHAMAQGGGGNGAGGGSGRDSQQQPQQQKSHQGREDDSARANAIAALMSAAASGNVSAEEAVSRMGAAAAAMGNSRPGMQNYPADGPNSNGVGMVNTGNNGKNTSMDGGQPPGKSSMGGMGSKKIVNLDQRNSVSSSDAAGQSAASIEEEDMLTSIHPSEVMELSQHTSEVFMCAWNPRFTNLIATGSGDASARIWAINGPNASTSGQQSILLPHGQDPVDRKNKDVTTLEWSSNGELLATGSYDGVARVWSRNGDLRQTLRGHRGPIFSLKWNKRGNFLLSGSYDKSTIVWDVSGDVGFVKQQFSFHFAPALDVDWKDDLTFASCSTDKTVQICRVGLARPIKTYTGHADEVNAVKWDPSGTLLASCSDDCTAKVWDVNSPRNEPKWDFKSHQQEIYTVKWSPTGPGSRNPNKLLMLATASFDGSVRLWNVLDGTCLRILSRHRESVYSVAFSPSGDFLASGSLAGQLYIWNVRDGVHIKSFKGKGDIFEVAWNLEESRVAACFSSNVVSVIDFKRP